MILQVVTRKTRFKGIFAGFHNNQVQFLDIESGEKRSLNPEDLVSVLPESSDLASKVYLVLGTILMLGLTIAALTGALS